MVVLVHHHQYQVLLLHMQVAAVDIPALVQLLQVVPVAAAMVEISVLVLQLLEQQIPEVEVAVVDIPDILHSPVVLV
jgi:hypothetical protein